MNIADELWLKDNATFVAKKARALLRPGGAPYWVDGKKSREDALRMFEVLLDFYREHHQEPAP